MHSYPPHRSTSCLGASVQYLVYVSSLLPSPVQAWGFISFQSTWLAEKLSAILLGIGMIAELLLSSYYITGQAKHLHLQVHTDVISAPSVTHLAISADIV